MRTTSTLAGASSPESAKKAAKRSNWEMDVKKFRNTETKAIKPRNGHLEDPKIVQKSSSNGENKAIKSRNGHLEDPKLVLKSSSNGENKGIKRGNEHLEKEHLKKKQQNIKQEPSPLYHDKMTHLHKLMKKLSEVQYPYCKEVSEYQILTKIGQGTFGEVFKAEHQTTKKMVALKKILLENEKEGFPITALREIKILQKLKHENIVTLIEVCRSKSFDPNSCRTFFYLVFEFCEHDLAGLICNKSIIFSPGEIKMVLKQLLNGLYFMHTNKILHRDIKAANILITQKGKLKIADFGLAKAFSCIKNGDKANRLTNRVVTLWYRPPELLLGEKNYGPSVDMWGVGCVMAEMWIRTPLIRGETEQHQLALICHLCGSITPETFPDFNKMPLRDIMLPQGEKRKVKERLQDYLKDPHALDLIDKFLTLDPAKRIDSDTALNHDFFWTDPLPCDLSKMLNPLSRSMFEYSAMRSKKEPGPHAPADNGEYQDRVF